MILVLAQRSSIRACARHVARITLVLIISSLLLTRTRAQDASPPRAPPPAAIDHYSRGRAHYQAGRYREAVIELEQALALDPGSPNLVYNLARVYELLGRIDPAIANYERYRSMLPASEVAERERVSSAIQRLEGARAQVAHAQQPQQPWSQSAPTPAPRVTRTERGVADAPFWTVASLSLAALTAGSVTGALGLKAERDALNFVLGRDGDQDAREQLAQKADRLGLGADIALAAGAVGGLTSILLYALRVRPVVQPSVALRGDGMTLTLRGTL